jgi:hypothetical protein
MDGLLLPSGPGFAFRRDDEFASDTVRDFALAVRSRLAYTLN